MAHSPAAIANASAEILAAYHVLNRPSGRVSITKLKISGDPAKWSFSFIRRPDLNNRRRATDLEICACVSPEWIHETQRMADYARLHCWLVSGTQPLPAPDGIDSITLISAAVLNGRRLALKPVKIMVFRTGEILQISKTTAAARFSRQRELAINTAVFKATVARRIANILLRRNDGIKWDKAAADADKRDSLLLASIGGNRAGKTHAAAIAAAGKIHTPAFAPSNLNKGMLTAAELMAQQGRTIEDWDRRFYIPSPHSSNFPAQNLPAQASPPITPP